MKQKDHAASSIREDWLPFVEKQAEYVVKRIRTDRGGEFLGAEMTAWLKNQGIQRELTMAYTPQSNGVAERANWTILDTARALLIESGVALEEAAGVNAEGVRLHGSRPRPQIGSNRDVKFVESLMYRGRKKQLEAKVSQEMEQITMQLDLTPTVWEEGEDGSTSGAAGAESAQQQSKAKAPKPPQRRKPKAVIMKGWETPVSSPGRTRMATMKLTAGADVAEQQLGNEEALLILPHGYDPDKEDESAYYAAASGKFIIQMDLSTAFLNGILEEDVYMTQPPGYEDGTDRVCKLKKSIYGLKQVPRCWYQKLAAVIEEMGFRSSSCDESLFLKGEGENLVLFLVYVDDILLFSSSMKEIQKVQQQLMKNFKCKTLGEVKYYLGIHVERDLDHRWSKLHQKKIIKELGEKYGIENERKVVMAAEDEGVEAEEQQQFQSLVGSLLYAAVHTRPDISFSVGQLARVVQNPSEEQVDAAERVVKYLNSHPSIGVQYFASAQVNQNGVEVLKEKGGAAWRRQAVSHLLYRCYVGF
ncbi:unnamed protein product [Closterium sp. NIES-54]